MTVRDVAKALEVAPSVVYSLCQAGLIGYQRIGIGRGTIRINQADLDAYVASARVEPQPRPGRPGPIGTGLAVRDHIGEMLAEKQARRDARAARLHGGGRSDG